MVAKQMSAHSSSTDDSEQRATLGPCLPPAAVREPYAANSPPLQPQQQPAPMQVNDAVPAPSPAVQQASPLVALPASLHAQLQQQPAIQHGSAAMSAAMSAPAQHMQLSSRLPAGLQQQPLQPSVAVSDCASPPGAVPQQPPVTSRRPGATHAQPLSRSDAAAALGGPQLATSTSAPGPVAISTIAESLPVPLILPLMPATASPAGNTATASGIFARSRPAAPLADQLAPTSAAGPASAVGQGTRELGSIATAWRSDLTDGHESVGERPSCPAMLIMAVPWQYQDKPCSVEFNTLHNSA